MIDPSNSCHLDLGDWDYWLHNTRRQLATANELKIILRSQLYNNKQKDVIAHYVYIG